MAVGVRGRRLSGWGRGVRRLAVLIVVMLWGTGCAGWSENSGARDAATVRADLAAHLANARSAQASAADLWDRLIFGEPVACTEAIPVPAAVVLSARDLTAHPQAGPIQTQINDALAQVRVARDLWDAECLASGAYVPLETAAQSRAAMVTAAGALDEAAVQLDSWAASAPE